MRREALEELLGEGMSQAEISRQLGLSRGRISQLLASGPPPERLFWGDDDVTVAIGGKLEAGKPRPGRVVALEDFGTFTELRKLLNALQLDATHEVIPASGMVQLNRPNLVVVCGPRLSPLLAQVIEADPVLAFAEDEHGWHIIDRRAGEVHRSLAPEHSDIAYFGRLPRLDGHGTFLYMAGIHAPGPAGIVHYLTTELGAVYREVGVRRFSTLIESRFDPATRSVVTSRRITPLYQHDG
ncbi:MAG: sigma factor-like helix-turn-helix DNA-binding protein [Solirubrobacteraceae bacterium]